ncbi:hypothetical protein CR513_58406, partial [Mucuna pruriens]
MDWEAKLKEQLESLRGVEGHSNPPPPRVTWGLPFSKQIDSTPIPPQFKELMVDPFDIRKTHAHTYKLSRPRGGNNLLSCKLFSGTFRRVTLRWFSSLPPHSITLFVDLAATFDSQFVDNKTKHLEVADFLFDIKQTKTEMLKQYLTRFDEAMHDRDQSPGLEACGGRGGQGGLFAGREGNAILIVLTIDDEPSPLFHVLVKETPFCIIFGTNAMIPIEVEESSPRTILYQSDNNEEKLRANLDLLQEEREMAHMHECPAKARVDKRYNSICSLTLFGRTTWS